PGAVWGGVRGALGGEPRPQAQMAPPRLLDERSPDRARQAVSDQQVPEAVRALVEIAHRQIGEHRVAMLRAAAPDRTVREESLIAPGVTLLELLAAHVLGMEHHVPGVVLVPVAVPDAPLGLELPEERRPRIRREDVEGGALEAVGFDPLHG